MSELEDSTGWFVVVAPNDGNFGVSMSPDHTLVRATSPCCNVWLYNDGENDEEVRCVLCRYNWQNHDAAYHWRVTSAWELPVYRGYSHPAAEDMIRNFVAGITGYEKDDINVDIS